MQKPIIVEINKLIFFSNYIGLIYNFSELNFSKNKNCKQKKKELFINKINLMDIISYAHNGKTSLKRFIQIDIDDMFVGKNGTRIGKIGKIINR